MKNIDRAAEAAADWLAHIWSAWKLGIGAVIICGITGGGFALFAALILAAPVALAEYMWGVDAKAALSLIAFAAAPVGIGFGVPYLRAMVADYEAGEAARRKRALDRRMADYMPEPLNRQPQ